MGLLIVSEARTNARDHVSPTGTLPSGQATRVSKRLSRICRTPKTKMVILVEWTDETLQQRLISRLQAL
jgi:hypothetical protein